MATEINVPTLGESVTEATIGKWFKQPGDAVKADEPLLELETDKVTLEVNAPAAGVLGEIRPRRARPSASAPCSARSMPAAPPTAGQGGPDSGPGKGRTRSIARSRQGGATRRREARCRHRPPPPRSPPTGGSIPPRSTASGRRGQVLKDDVLGRARASGRRRIRRRHPPPPPAHRIAGRRRGARGARAHDQAAPDHRAPPQGGAGQRGHADDLQRGRHDAGHGAAQPVQGPVREEARREARLHVLLRARLRAGSQGHAGRQRRDRRAGPRSTRTTTMSASPSAPRRAWSCR